MLITSCAHCQSRFRVTPQQLNARQGHVRCGRCNQVFNGFQSLERFPDDDTGARLLAAEQALERDALASTTSPAIAADLAEPAPEADARARIPNTLGAESPPTANASARSLRAQRQARDDIEDAPRLTLERPARAPVSRAWSLGVVLLLLVLALEGAFAFRGPVAQRYPVLRPALEAACVPLECSVPYAREDGLIKLEESEMLEVPGKAGEIALGARIRNLASVAQEYPHLELTLTDNTGQAAARRVLRPTDYLGRPLSAGEVIAPGVELALQLRLATSNLKPTGYELLLFYP